MWRLYSACPEHPHSRDIPSALVVAAYKAQSIGDWQRVDELCHRRWRLGKDSARFTARGLRWKPVVCRRKTRWRPAPMPMRFRRTHEPPNWPNGDGYPGLAAIFLAYKVS